MGAEERIKELEITVNSLQKEIKEIKSRVDNIEKEIEDSYNRTESVINAYNKRFPEDKIKEIY